jgi:hypothetical protein
MDDQEIRKYESFLRVSEFGKSNADSFPASSIAGKLFASLDSIIKELSGHAVKQTSSNIDAKGGTKSRSNLRDELKEDMMAISRTARYMRVDDPSFENKFRMPPSGSDQALLASARTFAINVAPYVSEFVSREMPEDFLEELNKIIDLFEKAISDQIVGVGNRVTASEAIDQDTKRGMDTVGELDSIVRNKFRKDPIKLAAWEKAKRLERAPRPAVDEETPAPETTDK